MFPREQLSNVCRIESLDAALKAREKELEEERSRFVKLKEDFKYNLRLLNDRHNELEKYDSVLAGAVNLSLGWSSPIQALFTCNVFSPLFNAIQ